MQDENNISPQFNELPIFQAYGKALDENIISTITDTKGVIVHANKKFCEISKYSLNEIIGQNHSIFNSGYHPKEFFKTMWQTIGKGNTWHHEIKNKAKDGTHFWLDTLVVPIKDVKEKNTHYLSLRTLITEKKQLEIKKEHYVSSLELLLVMTANGVKKPLSNCSKQLANFDLAKPVSKNELKQLVDNLRLSVFELDYFTKELATFIQKMEK